VFTRESEKRTCKLSGWFQSSGRVVGRRRWYFWRCSRCCCRRRLVAGRRTCRIRWRHCLRCRDDRWRAWLCAADTRAYTARHDAGGRRCRGFCWWFGRSDYCRCSHTIIKQRRVFKSRATLCYRRCQLPGVCLSVCPSQAEVLSKCSIHRRATNPTDISETLVFASKELYEIPGVHSKGGMKCTWVAKIYYFRLITRHISETLQNRDIITIKGQKGR